MTLELANTFAVTFMCSYFGDLFVIELILIILRILFFPEIERRVKEEEDPPVIFNLLYFFFALGTSGTRGGFF
jgi:hypothetical protein